MMLVPSVFPIQQAIDRHPPTVTCDQSLDQVLALMVQNRTNYILVVEQRQLVGIFTERDVVRMTAVDTPLSGLMIRDVMTPTVVSLQESEIQDVMAVLSLLRQHRIRHLPILNDAQEVTGVITHESIRNLLNPVDLLRLRRVSEVMATQVIYAHPTASIAQVSQLMTQHQVSCVVVAEYCCEANSAASEVDWSTQPAPLVPLRPVGIVTESDVVKLWVHGQDLSQTLAETLMSKPLLSVRPQETLWEAHELMQRDCVRRLVVIDDTKTLVGIVTQTSLLQVLDPVEAHIAIETLQQIIDERTDSLRTANAKLHRKIIERKRAKSALQKQIARERLVTRIAQRIRQSLKLEEILKTTVEEVRQFLKADRAFIYQFDADWNGVVVVESVDAHWMPIQGKALLDARFASSFAQFYQKGRIHSIPDILQSGLAESQIRVLAKLQIRANLVAPIVVEQDKLWGLLIVNQCSAPRQWEKLEVDLLKQLATQVGIAIQQAQLYQQLEVANQRLQQLAASDGLTQVANRRRFDECLEQEWRRLAREQQPLSLIMCDVDYFKRYNDTYGHLAGDDCLRQVAQALQSAVKRPADLVARYGGEEFGIVLPHTDLLGALSVARDIQAKIQAMQIPHVASLVSSWVTLSLGIGCTFPASDSNPTSLIAIADRALYQAKLQGRNLIISQACQVH